MVALGFRNVHRAGAGRLRGGVLVALIGLLLFGSASAGQAQSAPADPPSLEEVEHEEQQRKAEEARKAAAAEAEARRRADTEQKAKAAQESDRLTKEKARLAAERAQIAKEKARLEAERDQIERAKAGGAAGSSPTGAPAPTSPSPSGPRAEHAGMVEVPAGEFLMGCNEAVDSECDADEKPSRRMHVAGFWIDRTEVTVANYSACVSAGRCSSQGISTAFWDGKEQAEWSGWCNWGVPGRDDHPINCVSWDHAVAYCEWKGRRLPTEEEWEKAARGTDGRKYAWGSSGYGGSGRVANILDESARARFPNAPIAVGYDDGFIGTAPVGSFPAGASPYGALDMIGNVWEWGSGPGPSGTGRSVRGGSWGSEPGYARASYRGSSDPASRGPGIGFRCAQ